MRKVTSIENGDKLAKIYREDDEYIVKFYSCGVYQKEADYFTGDWSDAKGTAEIQIGLRKVVAIA